MEFVQNSQADNWTLGTENKKHIPIEFLFN